MDFDLKNFEDTKYYQSVFKEPKYYPKNKKLRLKQARAGKERKITWYKDFGNFAKKQKELLEEQNKEKLLNEMENMSLNKQKEISEEQNNEDSQIEPHAGWYEGIAKLCVNYEKRRLNEIQEELNKYEII